MVMKLVLKVHDLHDPKSKRKALKTVSSIEGVDSLAVDKEKKTLTVVGDIVVYNVVCKLRKLMNVDIEVAGPNKEEKKEKNEETPITYYYNSDYYPYYWPSFYTK
ncbi:hypothetical protein MLD38_018486 [Melastoma candidum]|uniref:Uncharacterized protein n=1 Tax=Melastoma candidum TaxID=119954 RepID=A0ACB9QU12_9MYRT|nr:hypothetical protein MLD38_018486 [Melastoma candidum]